MSRKHRTHYATHFAHPEREGRPRCNRARSVYETITIAKALAEVSCGTCRKRAERAGAQARLSALKRKTGDVNVETPKLTAGVLDALKRESAKEIQGE